MPVNFDITDDDGYTMTSLVYLNEEEFPLEEEFEIVEKVKEKEMNKESLFKVGDVVYDVVYGKGKVISIHGNYIVGYPIQVKFSKEVMDTLSEEVLDFTQDGKLNTIANRTLFFSEPKIEALTERPFVPTLVGKTLLIYSEGFPNGVVRKIIKETPDKIEYDSFGNYHMKKNILEMYEVSKENLVTHKG